MTGRSGMDMGQKISDINGSGSGTVGLGTVGLGTVAGLHDKLSEQLAQMLGYLVSVGRSPARRRVREHEVG